MARKLQESLMREVEKVASRQILLCYSYISLFIHSLCNFISEFRTKQGKTE
jgi:hypothetical protein